MRVALIADSPWLNEELPTLRRMVVGLIAEQVGVVKVVPHQTLTATEGTAMVSQTLTYPGSKLKLLRDWNVQGLADQLAESEVDVLHALDGSLERAVSWLALHLDVPVVCSIWSRREAEGLRGPPAGVSITYAAATPGLAAICRKRVGTGAIVEVMPPGVYCGSDDPSPVLAEPSQAMSILIVGDGEFDGYYESLLHGIAAARSAMPHAVFLFYAVGADQHRIWQLGSKLNLLEQISLAPSQTSGRRLLVEADVVIQPQASGIVRTMVLEAMAEARPVICAIDPLLDPLLSHGTALLLDRPTPQQWNSVLREIAGEPAKFIALGAAGRRHVYEHHPASKLVDRAMHLYHHVTGPHTLPFAR